MNKNAASHYSAADIARYHSGELSGKERHALEKAALSDPFLADALEGFDKTATPAADMVSLRTALAARVKKFEQKRLFFIPLWAPKVAAAFLVVAVLGWLAYQLPFSTSSPVAVEKKSLTIVKTVENANLPYTTADSTTITSTEVAADVYVAAKPSRQVKAARPQPLVAKPTFADSVTATNPAESVSEDSRSFETSSAQVASAPPQNFRGIITDTAGRGIPFASIKVAQTGSQVQSDAQGRFQVLAADTTARVTVYAVGYDSRQSILAPKTDNQLVLSESNASLQEVVVTGYGVKKQRAKSQVQEGQLEPKEGWNRYNDYLAESLNVPDEIAERPKTGEVTLSFDVNKSGEPTNIKVEKSLCDTCDQKAIRLLKEGPKWKTSSKGRGKIVIRF